MGGKKRKISIEKLENKDSRSVSFSKRRNGLYSKTSELCLLSGAQVAILATPISSKSYVSVYSFGHSSVDSVVSAFLANEQPPHQEGLGLGFWWEDEGLAKSEDTKELSYAVDSISKMLQNLKGLHSAAVENREDKKKKKKKDLVVNGTHQELDRDQTLNLQSTCASICIRDDPPANIKENQIVASSDNKKELDLDHIIDYETNGEGLTMNLEMDDVSKNRNSCSDSKAGEDRALVIYSNSDEDNNLHFSNLDEDQIVAISDNNNNSSNALPGDLYGCNEELDLDQIFDFVEDGADRDLDEDNLHFSEYFNELASIVSL